MKNAQLNFVKPNDKGDFLSRIFEISNEEVEDLKKTIIKVSREIVNGDFLNKKCDKPDCSYCRKVDIFNRN